jgi:predicted alpha-1,2-mannosidase
MLAGCALLVSPASLRSQSLYESLPMVGTDGHGHAYPGATVPFGMVQLSPDTRTEGWDACSGYHYSDSTILGFAHTHLSGTGATCLGDILLMPTVGDLQLDAGSPGDGYASKFSHDQEEAVPGYYRVFLQTPKVTAELTATTRCGFHQYTFPASDQSHFVLDLTHSIGSTPVREAVHIEDDHTVSGYSIANGWGGNRVIYFVMQFSKPFDSSGVERNGRRIDNVHDAEGEDVKAFFNYKTSSNEKILVKVGISGTGIEGARKNLDTEIPGWSFNDVRKAASAQWKKIFDTVEVKSFSPDIEKTFYANLYLTALAPVIYNDVDGSYLGYDHQKHSNPGFKNYSTISIWDIYRTEWPLLTLLHPDRINDIVQSMLMEDPQLGQHSTPIWPLWGNETWCMIGYHSVDMMTEAYLEGFRGFDAQTAYQQMRDTAMQDRNGLDSYKSLGYVPSKPHDSATSKTLEYTVDDWSLARMAESLGHTDDAKLFYQRSANYCNLFDRTTQFFRGRKADGSWRTPFIPNSMVNDEYTEADAWQYAFAVQQDVPGMISLYGGDENFIRKLDALFNASSTIDTPLPDLTGRIGQYVGGNEQSCHIAYLYDYAGAPYKSQYWVREAMTKLYGDKPPDEPGNIDCGQMAAWYVFSALGFYPVNPDSGIYVIGSPVVSKAVIHLDSNKYHGRTFTVIADNNSPDNIYIQSVTLNGKPLTRSWITRDEITAGGTLHFVMGYQPNPQWGNAPAERPPATMPTDFKYPALPDPATVGQTSQFPLPIQIVCGSDNAVAGFQPDPDMIQGGENFADVNVDTSAPNSAPADVYKTERYGSDFSYTFSVPQDQSYLVRLHFAEVFDNGAGRRTENISINGNSVLTNFDIYAAAGGMNKAVVKDFPNIEPNHDGTITIRVTATPDSPDQNAKLTALEILK